MKRGTTILTIFGCLVLFEQVLAMPELPEQHESRNLDTSELVSTLETLPEFVRKFAPAAVPPHEVEREIQGLKSLSKLSDIDQSQDELSVPIQFDARQKWKSCAKLIETIWDQGNCRSSSVIAAASMAADRLCIKTNGNFNSNLSAHYLMACSSSCDRNEPLYNPLKYISKQGIPTGGPFTKKSEDQSGCVPFGIEPCDHSRQTRRPFVTSLSLKPCNYSANHDGPWCPDDCTNDAYSKPIDEDTHKFKVAFEIDEYDELRIRREIFQYGPVAASFVLFDDFLTYKNGIYRHNGYGPYIRIQSIKLIGWGVDKNKVPYWLGVNSFGQDWGEKGLFKFYRGKNHLFLESMVGTGRF